MIVLPHSQRKKECSDNFLQFSSGCQVKYLIECNKESRGSENRDKIHGHKALVKEQGHIK